MNEKPVVLKVENLHTVFDTQDGVVHAVNGISYSLGEGQNLGIVGESGCGKSVSVLSVLRLLPQPPARITADSIRFLDESLLDLSDEAMRNIRGSQIAMIFQDPMTSLNPVFTIGHQLAEPLRLHLGMSKEDAWGRAAELLQLVGFPDPRARLKDYPHQFSGGMRQRAMIAMALTSLMSPYRLKSWTWSSVCKSSWAWH
jgi:ABC-type dipeptide/oligopeptide/nickel transport system ATPase component